MGGKRDAGLTPAQAKALARAIKPYVDRFESGVAAAKAAGISQSQLSQIMAASGRGAGVSVLCRLRVVTGLTLDQLLGLDPLAEAMPLDDVRAVLRVALEEMERRKRDTEAAKDEDDRTLRKHTVPSFPPKKKSQA